MSKFSLRFYRVAHCGYYKHGQPDPAIGDLDFFLEELREYAAGKNLEDTRVEGGGDRLPAYLFDIKQHGSCWILTLWNEVPADEGAVASVPASSPVGAGTVLSNPVAANSIPGFPTYFLFVPEAELVAPVVYGDSVFGLPQFKQYAHQFLENSTSVVHFDEDGDEAEVLGYEDSDGEVREDLRARFEIQLKRSGTQEAAIIKKAASIRSIIRVAEMKTVTQPERARFQRFLDFWGMTAAPAAKTVRIRQQIPVSVTKDQVKAMIDDLSENLVPKRNDIAFKFEKEAQPVWLSGSIASASYDLNVDKVDGVFSAEDLARAFSRRKGALIGDAG
ncbi:hypothetical protein I5W36_23225 [Stenotrophomonas maltophilia]|uniref:hypothetical protein n=1 Tax=Stenotrophomonas sp. 232 TaxID=2785387 RepID=UPI000AEAF4AD|nr:hypothetical protein [Stenotrophomonas sp. 232]MBF9138726.1 hypothetical protein [Stenotrophomonas sp. 232]MBH1517576.1 hypothetical protein [Stenotrophomonas maltophilia]MBH1779511.1 hypothetical protein [Stenotrophomonas maltophilia]